LKPDALTNWRPVSPPLATEYYRLVNADYASDIDEIAQTILHSWRYNPKGEFGVLYLSSHPECAYRELLKRVFGKKQNLRPLVVGRFRIQLGKTLDLRDSGCRQALEVTLEQLIDPTDFSVTQSLAREARKNGFEAILAPSAIGEDCHNLVVFKDRLTPPSVCICDVNSIRPYP
jgi:hypothetical protein